MPIPPPQPQESEPSSELALARKHNAALPIHTLPAEVLFQVIHLHMLHILSLEDWDREGYYICLIKLSGVCSHWYNVVRDSPPLWTRVYLSDPPRVVDMALQRSSCHPLDIVINQAFPENTLELQAFMEAINLHRDRWQNMNIRVPYQCMEGMIEALGGPPPNLEKLSFKDRDTISCSQEYDLFRGKAPRLINCTLDGVSIRWDSEVLHDLTILDISWVHFSSTESILHALSHSPQLQSLRIHRCGTRALAPSSSLSVQLSQLVWLQVDLRHEESDATKNFLDHIISDAKSHP